MKDAALTPERVRTLRIRHRWYQRAMFNEAKEGA
jgi:hypothetical protein